MKPLAQESAKNIFNNYIFNRVKKITNYHNLELENTGLLKGFPENLSLTHFHDLHDTLIYFNLISTAIELSPRTDLIVDLGAGSSIPSQLALKRSSRTDIKITAVDIDPEAMSVGATNAQRLGLSSQYSFQNITLEQALQSDWFNDNNCLVISNPPYIATPTEIQDTHFVPINGGIDGAKFLIHILEQTYKPGTILTLLWGSLTRPHEVIKLMEENYELLHVEAHKVHFGQYTKHPLIKSHLYELREQDEVHFEIDENNVEAQFVIGVVLKALSI